MAISNAKVLKDLNTNFTVVGRGNASAEIFFNITCFRPFVGGIEKILIENNSALFTHTIIATGIDSLISCLKTLVNHSILNILIEKPAALSIDELNAFKDVFMPYFKNILVAYNRRFYRRL